MWEQADGGSKRWSLKLITPPASEPISLIEAKAHLRVDFTDDDDYIAALIIAARMITEEKTSRALITQTWDYTIDDFPYGNQIKLRKPELQSVTSINYTDSSGLEHIMPTTDYFIDSNSKPGRIILGFSKVWPVVILQPAAAVRIRFVAGYGDATAIPQPLKQAMFYLISNWYENREPIDMQTRFVSEIPLTYQLLIGPYKVVMMQ